MALKKVGVILTAENEPAFTSAMKASNQSVASFGASAAASSASVKSLDNATKTATTSADALAAASKSLKDSQLDVAKATAELKNAQVAATRAGKDDEAAQKAVATASDKLKVAQAGAANEVVKFKTATQQAANETEQFRKGLTNLDSQTGHTGSIIKTDLSTAVLGLGAAAGTMAIAVGVNAVKSFVEFDAKLNTIKAVSNATTGEIKKMSDTALKLGADFPVSANQAAAGMVELSKAGFTANEVLQASHGLVLLATAANIDMGKSAEIVAGSIRGFGLAASDTNRVVDILAQAANASSVDVKDLGETFKYAAPVAKALGFTIEDVTAAASLMGNSMIKGSDAGTALRTIMINLTGGSATATKELDKLGVTVADSAGKMRSFKDILVDLRTKTANLSDAQMLMTANHIAGKEAVAAFLVVLKSSDKDFKAMFDGIQNATGAAGRMAKVMQEGLPGALQNLSGSVDTLMIKLGRGLAPGIQTVVESLNSLTNSSSDTAESIGKKLGDALGNLGPVINATAKLIPPLIDALNAFLAPVELAATSIGFMADRIDDLTGKVRPLPENLAGVATAATDLAAKVSDASAAVNKAGVDLGDMKIPVTAAQIKINELSTAIDGLKKSLQEESAAMSEAKSQISTLDSIITPLGKSATALWTEFKKYSDIVAAGGAGSADAAIKVAALHGEISKLSPRAAAAADAYGKVSSNLNEATTKFQDNTLAIIDSEKKQDSANATMLQTIASHKKVAVSLQDLTGVVQIAGNQIGENLAHGIAQGIDAAVAGIAAAAVNMVRAAKAAARAEADAKSPSRAFARDVGMPIGQGVAVGIASTVGEVMEASRSLVGAANQQMQQMVGYEGASPAGGASGRIGSPLGEGANRISVPATPGQFSSGGGGSSYTHAPNYNLNLTSTTPATEITHSFDMMRAIAL